MTASTLLSAVVVLLSIARTECFPRGRILGGSESRLNSRPYMVSLQVDGTHICGGLLISDEWVLSAAHCKPNSVNKTLQAVLGTIALSKPQKIYNIDTMIIHPQYNRTTKHHDLLLVKLPEKVPLMNSIHPLPYQTEDIVIDEKTLCLVAGWGKIKNTGKKPDNLNEAWVPVISPKTCNRADYYHGDITPNMICAGDKKRDSCEGDSGGPLICNGVATAIVSSGFSVCGNLKRPGIYTLIFPYKYWIADTMRTMTEPVPPVPTVTI
ncbi:serine protease ami-like [Leptodactylus fuscus]|uniref:serine protease ami-like n=1 Tax=Leptodactylus fuscus TaxID=238119 RepID=UPI003F4F281D